MREAIYVFMGYLCGSVLFARVCGKLLGKGDLTRNTADGNPGTTNAFHNGGMLCGILTLIGDIGKGFVPVFFYMQRPPLFPLALALVLAAPVIGHVFPLFFHFRGGKGIATTFGVLLGLAPNFIPVLCLAVFFVFFSVIVRIKPHYYLTLIVYGLTALTLPFLTSSPAIFLGFFLILAAVAVRMLTSREEKQSFEVKPIWTR